MSFVSMSEYNSYMALKNKLDRTQKDILSYSDIVSDYKDSFKIAGY